ncbi:MAG: DUF3127 domain-containing protein [Balneolaceae bacterium]
MDLKITGKVTKVLPEQSGTGKNGEWRKRDFILETAGQYPKQVCITEWGDNIDQNSVQEGESITAHIDIQSREYNEKWYTDVKAWKIEKGGSEATPPPPSAPDITYEDKDLPDLDEDLPF